MNATRAATIRGRAWVGGVVSLGRVQTPTLALMVKREREIQAFVPEPYWLVHAQFDPTVRGPLVRGRRDAAQGGEARRGDRGEGLRQGRHRRVGRAQGAVRARAAALRPDLAAARREPPLRLLRAPHAAGRAVALRGQEGDHLPANQLTLALRRPRPAAEADRRDAPADRRVRRGRALRARPAAAAARARRQRLEGHRPPRDHPDRRRARRQPLLARRAAHLRPGRPPLPGRLPPAGALRPHDGGHARRGGAIPFARQDHPRGRLARRLRAALRGRPAGRAEAGRGGRERERRAAAARAGPDDQVRRRPRSRRRRRSRRRATPRRRCSRRWRPRAS